MKAILYEGVGKLRPIDTEGMLNKIVKLEDVPAAVAELAGRSDVIRYALEP